jgi:histidinol-phosphatase (PHP family)
MHTPLCKHAVGTPSEYAAMAAQRGLRGIIVTCHNPMPHGFAPRVRMAVDELKQYVDLVQRTREQWTDKVDVRLGLEADYLPGFENWLEQQLASYPFDYVLGSLHPSLSAYQDRYWSDDPVRIAETYFDLLAAAAETGLFDCLSHPDVIKNDLAEDWSSEPILPAVRRALDRIAATGIAMELNTSGADKHVAEMNPFPAMLAEIGKRGIPVVVGADAHTPNRVADRYPQALNLLENSGFSDISLFLGRQRQTIPIPSARRSLSPASIATSNC